MKKQSDKLIEQLSESLEPVKPLASPLVRATIWLSLSLALSVTCILSLGYRSDVVEAFSHLSFLVELVLAIVTLICSTIAVFVLNEPGSEGRILHRILAVASFALLIALLLTLVFYDPPAAPKIAWGCGWKTMAFSLIPAALVFWYLRGGFSVELGWTGGLALLAAGSLGLLSMSFVCSMDEPLHLLLWHVVPVLLLVFAGYILARVILKRGK